MGELYVEINHEYHKSMAAFHRRNNKNERIVGWYATTTLNGEFLVDNSSLIHNFYSNECANPIHLVVDTTLLRDSVSVRGFMGSTMTVADEPLANTFQEVQVNLDLSDSEVTCLNHMINGQSEGSEWSNSEVIATIPPEKEQIPASLNEMVATIDEILQYVDEIVEGKRQPTREIGVAISEALTLFSSYSNSDPAAMSDAQNKSQDLLLVTFLSSLTQAQSLISSKLNSIL